MALSDEIDFERLNWAEQLILNFDLASFLAYVKNRKGNLGDCLGHLNLSLGTFNILRSRGYLVLKRNPESPIHTARVTNKGEFFIAMMREVVNKVFSLKATNSEERLLVKCLKSAAAFFVAHDKNLVEKFFSNKERQSPLKRKVLSRGRFGIRYSR